FTRAMHPGGSDVKRLHWGEDDVSLHCFPTDKKRRKEWENACGRTQFPKDPRLCSRHFSPDLTGAAGYKRRLKPDAVPTIFPHKASKRCSF
uniref:THAP domain-containing protein 1 n=1 Tax=Myripristis murdjan TaxID=586833 RepID=A0A667ZYF9_9TELE